jgi:hypothetical protein
MTNRGDDSVDSHSRAELRFRRRSVQAHLQVSRLFPYEVTLGPFCFWP